ncbi:hypothetical protein EON67_02360 [archaeon]|nr:MAG: hypothetical protein EON67_02360 [archaeon]
MSLTSRILLKLKMRKKKLDGSVMPPSCTTYTRTWAPANVCVKRGAAHGRGCTCSVAGAYLLRADGQVVGQILVRELLDAVHV